MFSCKNIYSTCCIDLMTKTEPEPERKNKRRQIVQRANILILDEQISLIYFLQWWSCNRCVITIGKLNMIYEYKSCYFTCVWMTCIKSKQHVSPTCCNFSCARLAKNCKNLFLTRKLMFSNCNNEMPQNTKTPRFRKLNLCASTICFATQH